MTITEYIHCVSFLYIICVNFWREWKHPADFIGNAGPDKDTQLTKMKVMYIKYNAMKTDT